MCAVRTLFTGEVHVSYSQAYVESDRDVFDYDLAEAFAGQVNGLCGAGHPGRLWLATGLHTGNVPFTVEAHDRPPEAGEAWEEIVEVSFRPGPDEVLLLDWGGSGPRRKLDVDRVDYRVRYCASGMDAGHAANVRMDDEPEIDRYLLQLWPAPPGPDRVVKQTSLAAAYWHRFARDLPPPPTPEQRAVAQREAEERQRRADEAEQMERDRMLAEIEARAWGGRPPSERLRTLSGNVRALAALDRDLVDAIVEAGSARQRDIARWAARRAYATAGLSDLDWAAAGLAALDRGDPLPPPFDDRKALWAVARRDRQPNRFIVMSAGRRVSQPAMALPALLHAAEPDPLEAALLAVYDAVHTYGDGYPEFFDDLVLAFL